MAEFYKLLFFYIILEPMTRNIVICEVDALMYVVLSKQETHVPYGELVGTVPLYTVISEVSHQPRSL